MRRLFALALTTVCLAPFTGCGGGSPTAWRDEADAICRAHQAATAGPRARLEALSRTGIRTRKERAVAIAILRRGLPGLEREIALLRQLDRSGEKDASTEADLLELLEMKHLIGEDLIEAFESGDAARTYRVVDNLAANEAHAERLARRLGLRVCGHI